jgi:hypothetical protein
MSISKNIDRRKVLLILDWCIKRFGKSRYYKNDIKLKVYTSAGTSFRNCENVFGSYSNGNIHIFLGSHSSVQKLCHTVVHEYKHYLLNEHKWDMIYTKMIGCGMDGDDAVRKHPHEKICDKFEKKWGPICYKELKHKLYKKYL